MCAEVLRDSDGVSRLHEHCSRSRELAHQTFTGREIANNTSGGNALEDVLAVPGDEVTVVDNVFLAFSKLSRSQLSPRYARRTGTYVFSDDSTEALDPQ